ncbi:hypothetical protein GCM10010441_55330 [Kitasatospora paracochleata]|uniref:PepSY domain-containing protein n=1 Tax=Kitasatospora paracochleata TaxID=58354 RepID=A0ABT1J6E8_9ACTN|nr:hypothetical protein [Kitasatospora paracochleata]MCP2313010.1 hypothetical protein [Kitasatospora paracochleata]
MSEPIPPVPSEPGTEETAALPPVAAKSSFRQRYVHLPRRRRTRWLVAGAGVVAAGVVVAGAAAAVVHHHDERVQGVARAEGPFGKPMGGKFGHGGAPGDDGGAVRVKRGPGGRVTAEGAPVPPGAPGAPGTLSRPGGQFRTGPGALAPAALPAVPADQAAVKAAAAVPGGRVAGVTVVGREGGGSSWAVVVLGTDGVRHLVTVDGTDGSITGNTVEDGR